ncbi:lipoprotein-releasing ABC transporter permease subunit [Prosthecomicrobium sp. N25]|uniref:lipoprotein-releasing ABC transporter permease subunit n=1 Tax=Prosthecomicrobium sp. N25 TaxID=3129254 RepID=UPI0030777A23
MAVADAVRTDAEPTETRPFSPFEWMIAWRYLRSRRREAFISIIAGFSFVGIMLGVATLITVMAVMNGFREELLGKMLGLNGHMIVMPTDAAFTDFDEVASRIGFVEGVKFAIPFVEGQALASGPAAALGTLVRGIKKEDLDKITLVSGNVQQGTLEGFDQSKGVAVGEKLAEKLGLRLGDPITIVTPRGNVTPMGVTPRVKAFPIVAIFKVGMSEYDAAFVFMPFVQAQAYFNTDDKASAVDVFVQDPDKVGDMRKAVEIAAQRSVFVTDWRFRNVTFFSALEVERNVMFLILTMIVLVAALNIIAGLTMLVKDKSRDIAILRTMGAERGSVMRIFFITGAAIGTTGTAAGVLLGFLICRNIEGVRQFLSWVLGTNLYPPEIYFLSRMKAVMHTGETVSVVLLALGLSLLATVYPAWKAARLDPVEALRYE